MFEYIQREAITTEKSTNKKIKAFTPHIVVSEKIVVGKNIDTPYYSICYYDVETKEWYNAYGSYNLRFVKQWLKECFEKVEVDMVEVKHGKWLGRCGTGQYDDYYCSLCGKYEEGTRNKNRLGNYCSWCGAKMDGAKNG